VTSEFEELHEKMKKEDNKNVRVIHGGVLFQPKKLALPEADPEIAFMVSGRTALPHARSIYCCPSCF
jgi:hypothetical protein